MADEPATTTTETPEQPAPPPDMVTLADGDFTAEIRPNGIWPKARDGEPDRPAYSLTIKHKEYGQLEHDPQCASNHSFCATRFAQFVNNWRAEEAARKGEGNGDGT